MKKFIYTLAVGSLLAVSCENKLEIDPEQDLATDLAFANKENSFASLMGVYSLGQDYTVFGALPQVIADFQADNVNFIGSFPTLQEIDNYDINSSNSTILPLWRDNFGVIAAANAVIKYVPEVEDESFNEAERAQYVAEAKFVRALVNFQMVNLFGQPYNLDNGASLGVPIVLEPFEGEITYPARSTVNEVHQQIFTDLQEALPALLSAGDFGDASSVRGRATKGAARALMARLHLYRGEYQQAADLSKELIDDGDYTLAPDHSFYDANTPEDIFTIQNSATDNGATSSGGWASYYNSAENNGRGDAPFSADLIAAFEEEAGDKRFLLSRRDAADEPLFTTKFPDASTNSDNAPIIRITEMYLTRAEALAELDGINSESLDLVNDLRDRAGLSLWDAGDFANADEFIEAILNERRKELCFEGHRRMDLLRKGKSLRTEGPGESISAPGDPAVILPIPEAEREVNPNLEQNDGY